MTPQPTAPGEPGDPAHRHPGPDPSSAPRPGGSEDADSAPQPSGGQDSGADGHPGHGGGQGGANGTRQGGSVRVDSWIWSVRLIKSRSMAATACRGGHVRVNGERVKPAHGVRVGDEVRLRHAGRERIVVVKRLLRKRVGAPEAVLAYLDNSPPPPPREAVAPAGVRDRGAGRPTKRDRRELERLRGGMAFGGVAASGVPRGFKGPDRGRPAGPGGGAEDAEGTDRGRERTEGGREGTDDGRQGSDGRHEGRR